MRRTTRRNAEILPREDPMTSTSRNFAAILLLLLVAVEFGGGSLLNLLTRRIPGYLDNPLRQNM
jgi:hypothetical protein